MNLPERILVTIIALSFMAMAVAVVKNQFFPARAGEVSFTIDAWTGDPSWWSPRYSPGNVGDRWTFGGAHSYTTRQLMGQRL